MASSLGLLLAGHPFGREAAAKASLARNQGEPVGTAEFGEAPESVSLTLAVTNFPPGAGGFRIHTVGKCKPRDFKSAGGHFIPDGRKHSLMNSEDRHTSDRQNLTVGARDGAKTKVLVAEVPLGEPVTPFFPPPGTALRIHGDPDELKTNSSGTAGSVLSVY